MRNKEILNKIKVLKDWLDYFDKNKELYPEQDLTLKDIKEIKEYLKENLNSFIKNGFNDNEIELKDLVKIYLRLQGGNINYE
jgi:hypothetical protein